MNLRFILGTLLVIIGSATPILTHKAYVDEYHRFNKQKAALILVGSFMVMIMGCYLMIHSEI